MMTNPNTLKPTTIMVKNPTIILLVIKMTFPRTVLMITTLIKVQMTMICSKVRRQ